MRCARHRGETNGSDRMSDLRWGLHLPIPYRGDIGQGDMGTVSKQPCCMLVVMMLV